MTKDHIEIIVYIGIKSVSQSIIISLDIILKNITLVTLMFVFRTLLMMHLFSNKSFDTFNIEPNLYTQILKYLTQKKRKFMEDGKEWILYNLI